MRSSGHEDLSHLSMLELFRVEAEAQTAILTAGLLELERHVKAGGAESSDENGATDTTDPGPPARSEAEGRLLESLMRAAHSLKGAARIVNLGLAVQVAHAMEDCFVAAQQERLHLGQAQIGLLLRGVDFLVGVARCSESGVAAWETAHAELVIEFATQARTMAGSLEGQTTPSNLASGATGGEAVTRQSSPLPIAPEAERVVRLNAENLNRLLGLAGESLVESRWLRPFAEGMQRLKRMQGELELALDGLRRDLPTGALAGGAGGRLQELVQGVGSMREFLARRLEELDVFDRRSAHLSNRLYLEVLRTRMRPFGEGTQGFARMVRDLSVSLGKQMRLEVVGEQTQVDRDILERLEAPLVHLLRNAVDHGCELPAERTAAGKPAEGVVVVEARHSAGLLLVSVADDGRGVDVERVRTAVVARGLTSAELAQRLTEGELLEFLFLPGFSLKESVTEVSGRGVGLDVVQDLVKSVRGTVRVATVPGRGMRFQLQLPLTLSVLRTLLVTVGGEPYAIPLGQITQALRVGRERVEWLEGRPHFAFGDERVGLVEAQAALGVEVGRRGLAGLAREPGLLVVVLGERQGRFGLVVDGFLGERELVVQPLDGRLGKVPGISAAALMEDGSPVLIVDVEDLLCGIEKLIASGLLTQGADGLVTDAPRVARKRKRVLAVDDSLTVRELVRKLLTSRGYLTEVAVDGVAGWNEVRAGTYDLVITDVDMPRMDGIELARLIKQDAELKSVPVMIVSYKDREADRLRGLEAGADYYLTKGSFHDETLLAAVVDLIGEAEE